MCPYVSHEMMHSDGWFLKLNGWFLKLNIVQCEERYVPYLLVAVLAVVLYSICD